MIWNKKSFQKYYFSNLFMKSAECKSSSFSDDVDNFVASKAERRLSMFDWPRTDRPVAFDIVLDFVIREWEGVDPPTF